MNVNLTTLPCPRCGKPSPVEACICTCGQRFLRTSSSDEQYSLALVPSSEEPYERVPDPVAFTEHRIRPRRVFVAFSTLVLALVLTFITDRYQAADSSGTVDDASRVSSALPSDVQPSSVARPDKTTDKSSVETTSNSLTAGDQNNAVTQPQNFTASQDRRVQATVLQQSSTSADEPLQRQIAQPDAPDSEERARASDKRAIPTARCADGTYSYSSSAAGACSERGGVAERLTGQHDGEPSLALNRIHQTGPRGGCYYISGSGSKVYVKDRSLCGQD